MLMSSSWSGAIVSCLAFFTFCEGLAAQEPGKSLSGKSADSERSATNKEILDAKIATKKLPDETSLSALLKALEDAAQEGRRLSVRLDEAAFGKDYAKIAAVQVKLLPHSMTLRQLLYFVLSQVESATEIEMDYLIDRGRVVITRRQADPPRAEQAAMILSVAVSGPESKRELKVGERHPVVLTNVTKTPIRIWCGWPRAWECLSFDFEDSRGKKWSAVPSMLSRRDSEKTVDLNAGESIIFPVLMDEEWFKDFAGASVKMRVRYDVPKSLLTRTYEVWTGGLVSAGQEYVVRRP